MTKTETAQTAKRHQFIQRRPRFYFAIYYSDSSSDAPQSFKRAALTWQRDLGSKIPNLPAERIILKPVSTEQQFYDAWNSLTDTIRSKNGLAKDGIIFSHASKGSRIDGLEFKGNENSKFLDPVSGTLDMVEITRLQKLDWDVSALLTLCGCNTGLLKDRGWAPAQLFSKFQSVDSIGQGGYAYFSEIQDSYQRIDTNGASETVYLWAYHHGKNATLRMGDDHRIPGIKYDK